MLKKKAVPQVRGTEVVSFSGLLEEKGISTESLAKALHAEYRIVFEWCMGHKIPNAIQTVEIARVLDCSVKEVYLAILHTPIPSGDEPVIV